MQSMENLPRISHPKVSSLCLQIQQFVLLPFLKCFGLNVNLTEKSTSAIDVLQNQDLLEEILLHLPPSSVVRIKSVCKLWYEIISNPNFLQRHAVYFRKYKHLLPSILLQRRLPDEKQPLFLCFDLDNKPWYQTEFELQLYNFVPRWENLLCRDGPCKILHSCNGLILINLNNDVFVCNPLMKKYVQIPRYEPTSDHVVVEFGMNLAFDPLIALDYKIVGIFKVIVVGAPILMYRYLTAVYSSLNRSWGVGKPQHLTHLPNISTVCEGVFMNGAIHWPPEANGMCLLSFVLESESVQITVLPSMPPLLLRRSWNYLGASKDHLYLYEECIPSEPDETSDHYNLYEIKSDYTVKEILAHAVIKQRGGKFRPMCFHNDGEEVLYCSRNGIIHTLYIKTEMTNKIIGSLPNLARTYTAEVDHHRVWVALPYTNTLFPLG